MAEKKSKTESLLEKGKILEAWPFKNGAWALSVTPVPQIDKMKFSFFKKGCNGKGFDIFVDGLVFLQLISILTRCNLELREKWEYRTGVNGSKSLSLEKGSSALIAVHGWDKESNENATVGLNREQVSGMLTLYNMFCKQLFESKWKKAFDVGLNSLQNRKFELTDADADYTEEAAKEPAKETSSSQPEGSVLLNGTLADDLAERGKFLTISVVEGGKLWVEKENGYKPEPGTKVSLYCEQNGENFKFIKVA